MPVEVRAVAKDVAISPQKARLIADQIRGKDAARALAILSLSPKKGARLFAKVLTSAIANAEQNNGLDVDKLMVSTARVDEGQKLRRFRPRAMGRIRRRIKRRSHLVVGVRERE